MGEPGDTGVLIPATCPSCGSPFVAKLSDRMTAKLREAGVTAYEIAAAINGGLSSWRIVCPDCQRAQQN